MSTNQVKTSTSSTCDQVLKLNAILETEVNRIGFDTARTIRNFWVDSIHRECWPLQMNEERPGATPPPIPARFGMNYLSYGLCQVAVESPILCVMSLMFNMDALRAVYFALQQRIIHAMEDRYRDEYVRIAGHKVIATEGHPQDLEFPVIAPTMTDISEILQIILHLRVRDGLSAPAALVMSADDTGHFSTNRFELQLDTTSPRWKIANNEWVRIQPFVKVTAEIGHKDIINQEYLDAPFADIIIFDPRVYTSLHESVKNEDPQAYRGVTTWENKIDPVENPDGHFGYLRTIITDASRPIYPDNGWVIRYKRP